VRLPALIALFASAAAPCACVQELHLADELPAQGNRTYEVRWRAGARYTLATGDEKGGESQLSGRLVVEPAGSSRWRARIERATQHVSSPPEIALRPDPAALAGLVFTLERAPGERPRVGALARPEAAVVPLLSPKTPVLAAALPPLPAGPVRRGARWEQEVGVSWPHPAGTLDGTARLRLRFTDMRRDRGRRYAVVRVLGDLELRSLSRSAPSYRGALRADAYVDLEARAVFRAIVEDEWIAAVRDAAGREVRMNTRGEWTMDLAGAQK
jgi:hypothetical protein